MAAPYSGKDFQNPSVHPSCHRASQPSQIKLSTHFLIFHIDNIDTRPENDKVVFFLSPLSKTLDPVEPVGRSVLIARALAPHRQAHGVSPTTVRTHILQSLDVILHNLARVVLDRHGGQLCRELKDRLGRERLDALAWKDGEFGHDALGGLCADGEERGESFLLVRC